MKARETFYRRHTVPVTSCSEVKYVLKRVSLGSKDTSSKNWNQGVYFKFYLVGNPKYMFFFASTLVLYMYQRIQ